MKRKIRLSPLAQFDLEATYSYIEARHPRAAQRWLQELEQFFNLLLKKPRLGMAYDHVRKGMRRTIKKGYKILYRIHDDEILIVRIFHPHRDINPSDWD